MKIPCHGLASPENLVFLIVFCVGSLNKYKYHHQAWRNWQIHNGCWLGWRKFLYNWKILHLSSLVTRKSHSFQAWSNCISLIFLVMKKHVHPNINNSLPTWATALETYWYSQVFAFGPLTVPECIEWCKVLTLTIQILHCTIEKLNRFRLPQILLLI